MRDENPNRLTMNTDEAADYLGCGRNQLMKLINDPTSGFPFVRLGRNIRIPKKELEEWLSGEVVKQREKDAALVQSVQRSYPDIPKIY